MKAFINRARSEILAALAVPALLAAAPETRAARPESFLVAAKEGDATAVLDTGAASVVKEEVRHSMLGVRDTVIFYIFPEQRTVLRVRIGNADTTFPIEAVLHRFADDATADGLKKWVNNQHSDALFIDAAQPTGTRKIPPALLKIESHRKTGRSQQHNGAFDDYGVKYRIEDFAPEGGPKLKGFTDEAKVHVKAG